MISGLSSSQSSLLFLLDIGPDYERVFKAIFNIIDLEDEPLIFNCDLIKQLQQGAAYHCR